MIINDIVNEIVVVNVVGKLIVLNIGCNSFLNVGLLS